MIPRNLPSRKTDLSPPQPRTGRGAKKTGPMQSSVPLTVLTRGQRAKKEAALNVREVFVHLVTNWRSFSQEQVSNLFVFLCKFWIQQQCVNCQRWFAQSRTRMHLCSPHENKMNLGIPTKDPTQNYGSALNVTKKYPIQSKRKTYHPRKTNPKPEPFFPLSTFCPPGGHHPVPFRLGIDIFAPS